MLTLDDLEYICEGVTAYFRESLRQTLMIA